jgi:HK97 gp10 family phage protein
MAGFTIIMDTFTPKVRAAPGLIPQKVGAALEKDFQAANDMASAYCPVDTGYLRSTIYHKVGDNGFSAELGATADYAGYVELGTRHMVAEPFIRPALSAILPVIAIDLRDALMAAFMG